MQESYHFKTFLAISINFGGITNHGLNFKVITDHDCIFDTPIMNHRPFFDPITDHEKTHPV